MVDRKWEHPNPADPAFSLFLTLKRVETNERDFGVQLLASKVVCFRVYRIQRSMQYRAGAKQKNTKRVETNETDFGVQLSASKVVFFRVYRGKRSMRYRL